MTPTDTIDAAPSTLSAESLQKLEALADLNGWTLDETLNTATGLLHFALTTVPENEEAKVYAYRNGKRFSIGINR